MLEIVQRYTSFWCINSYWFISSQCLVELRTTRSSDSSDIVLSPFIKMAVYAPSTVRNCYRLPDKLFCFRCRSNRPRYAYFHWSSFSAFYKIYKTAIECFHTFSLTPLSWDRVIARKCYKCAQLSICCGFLSTYKTLNYLIYVIFKIIVAPLK